MKISSIRPHDWPRVTRKHVRSSRFQTVQEDWRRQQEAKAARRAGRSPGPTTGILVEILQDVAAGKYRSPSDKSPLSGRALLEATFPTAPTDIVPELDLHAHVHARWPSGTSNEHEMIETMMRAHPHISDRTLRIYLGLRRGSVAKAEW